MIRRLLTSLGAPLLASLVVAAPSVDLDALEADRRPARSDETDGPFELVRIEGEAAAPLWRPAYWFAPGGSYTAAALVFDGARAAFQTPSGGWSLEDGLVDLPAPPRASVAGELLRLVSDAGVAVFRRVPIG